MINLKNLLELVDSLIKAERLLGIVNAAQKQGKTVSVTKGGKTYELVNLLYWHYKTAEYKSRNGVSVIFKHTDMVSYKVNEG